MTTVFTCGTFDLFHIGHLNLLMNARKLGDKLVVGVSSDFLNITKKNKLPIIPLYERLRIIKSLKCVDDVFIEESITIESKFKYAYEIGASIFAIADDWAGHFDDLEKYYKEHYDEYVKDYPSMKKELKVIYIPRTEGISTSLILDKFQYKSIDYKNTMVPKISDKLKNTTKLDYTCLMICRDCPHHAEHLLPYSYLFKSTYWLPDNPNIDVSTIENKIGEKIKIVPTLEKVKMLKPDVCFITESWLPYYLFLKEINCKTIFIDHGICVGTRSPTWFAMEWLTYADKIYVAGDMQYKYHKLCSGMEGCHKKQETDIIKIGFPRSSTYSRCDWMWDINYNTNCPLKKILYIPTSSYDELYAFYNIVDILCKKYMIIIRPHPQITHYHHKEHILSKIYYKCVDNQCDKNLLIISPKFNIFTPNLFYDADLLIMDKSSLAYEYLLFDKPGITIGTYDFENPKPELYIKDAFLNITNISLLTPDIIEHVISDPPEYSVMRKKVRDEVFCDTNENWIDNVKNNIISMLS